MPGFAFTPPALFALADRIEAKPADARLRVDALTGAVLAKAFRGELVPPSASLDEGEGASILDGAHVRDHTFTARIFWQNW